MKTTSLGDDKLSQFSRRVQCPSGTAHPEPLMHSRWTRHLSSALQLFMTVYYKLQPIQGPRSTSFDIMQRRRNSRHINSPTFSSINTQHGPGRIHSTSQKIFVTRELCWWHCRFNFETIKCTKPYNWSTRMLILFMTPIYARPKVANKPRRPYIHLSALQKPGTI